MFFASLNGPVWFQKFDSVFQIIFALVTIAISMFSYKVFHFTKDKKFKYFSLAFIMVAIGYLINSFSNLLIYLGIYDGVLSSLHEFNLANAFFLASILFTLMGYMLLIIVSMDLKQKRLVALLLAIILLFVAFSYQYFFKFHMVSFLLLSFITWQYYENYHKKKTINAGLVFASFYMLSFAELFFVGVMFFVWSYVIAHVMQLIGFGLLLTMFIKVVAHGRKKK